MSTETLGLRTLDDEELLGVVGGWGSNDCGHRDDRCDDHRQDDCDFELEVTVEISLGCI